MSSDTDQRTAELTQTLEACRSGANWFFWIAGLSLVNSVILLTGNNWGFIMGLGVTQIIDGIGLALAEQFGPAVQFITFACSAVAAGTMILWGFFARKAMRWAFIVGMVLYALDGCIFLLLTDFMSLAFHGVALFYMFRGFRAAGELREAAKMPLPVRQPSLTDQLVERQLEAEQRPAA